MREPEKKFQFSTPMRLAPAFGLARSHCIVGPNRRAGRERLSAKTTSNCGKCADPTRRSATMVEMRQLISILGLWCSKRCGGHSCENPFSYDFCPQRAIRRKAVGE